MDNLVNNHHGIALYGLQINARHVPVKKAALIGTHNWKSMQIVHIGLHRVNTKYFSVVGANKQHDEE